MNLSFAIKKFITDRQVRMFTSKTIQNYRDVLGAFLRFTGDIDIESITYDIHILRYNKYLISKGLSRASVGSYLRQIKAFFNYLEEQDIIKSGTIAKRIKPPKGAKKNINLFTGDDIKMIFESIHCESEWLTIRNKLLVCFMYDSGLRQEELTKILKADFDFTRNVLTVHGKGNKDRYVPFGKTTREYIDRYLLLCPFDMEYFFCDRYGKRITCNLIKKFINKLQQITGIEGLSSHKLRHNFATNFCIDGYIKDGYVDNIKLKTLMGHESLLTTEVYMHEAYEIVSTTHFRSHLDNIL